MNNLTQGHRWGELRNNNADSKRSMIKTLLLLPVAFLTLGVEAEAYTSWPPPSLAVTAAVPVEAVPIEATPAIQLNFPRPGAYQIFRKAADATTWGTALVTLPASSTTWTDTGVSAGQLYEYKAVLTDAPISGYGWASTNAIGYVLAGIKVDQTQPRGRFVVVVANDVLTNFPTEYAQYKADLVADGWFVHEIVCDRVKDYRSNGTGTNDVSGIPTAPYPNDHINIRNQIIALYTNYPGEVKNVVLLGKVPVCRTGSGYVWDPDGHGAELCCYGADGYYANMAGTWTDTGSNRGNITNKYYGTSVANEVAGGYNNVEGDGKFDQYYMYQTGGQADLGFGRIDLSNHIAGEYGAMQTYFNKLHRYKIASPDFQPGRRIAIRTGFPQTDETGLGCAHALVGQSNIETFAAASLPPVATNIDADAAYTTTNGPYLFYFKGNGGPAISVNSKAVFWTGMQSHWGWWYSSSWSSGQNDLQLRDSEDGFTLSYTWNIFGLRYFYHRMGMGLDAGDMMRVSINNSSAIRGTYAFGTHDDSYGGAIAHCEGGLFMNHFGDPALRLYMFAPPAGLSVVKSGSNPSLSWTASPEPTVLGYHIYRTATAAGPFTRLTTTPVAGTTYVDTSVSSGAYSYMVRAVRLETTGCGTFYNASLGIQQAIDIDNVPATLQVSTVSLPDASWSTSYQATLAAQGGTPLFNWDIVSGTLPAGLTLAANGTIFGVPIAAGTNTFTARATDALGQTATKTLSVAGGPNATVTLFPEAGAYTDKSQSGRNQGGYEAELVGSPNYETFLRYNLSGVNLHNGFVSAKLVLYVGSNTTAGCYALIQSALTTNAGDNWAESALCYTNKPADTLAVAPVSTYTYPVPWKTVELDVTPLVEDTLVNDPAKKLGLRLSTATPQTIEVCSQWSYGICRPRLVIQASDAPVITISSPANNPAYIFFGSRLQIIATATAIPARAGSVSVLWTKQSGPGTVTFSTTAQASTSVSFSAPGDYALRLSADDSVLQSYKDLTVRVVTAAVRGPSDSSLMMRLSLDEGSGTNAVDYSGVTPPNSGILNAGAGWTASGKINGALSLDGAGHYVDVPDSSTNLLDGMQKISISAWINQAVADTGTLNYHAIVSKRKASFSFESYAMRIRGGNNQVYMDVNNKSLYTNAGIGTNKWYHLVMVFDGSLPTNNLRSYVNGSADKFATIYSSGSILQTNVPRNSNSHLYVGAHDNSDTLGFNGLIDEVRVYSKALTEAEIQDLYAAAPTNLGPVINTTNAVSGNAGQPIALSAIVTDDGKPGLVTLGWTKISGPGSMVFGTPSSATTTATPSAGGTYVLRLSANDGGITTWADVNATVAGPSTLTIADWRLTYFGTTNNTGAAADLANPAGDGYVNLLKYALGLNPTVNCYSVANPIPLPTAQPQAVNGTNYLTYTFAWNTNATDISYAVWAANDLNGSWASINPFNPVNQFSLSNDFPVPGLQTITVKDTQPISDSSTRFMRLQVTIP
jgi:hypothetical protein